MFPSLPVNGVGEGLPIHAELGSKILNTVLVYAIVASLGVPLTGGEDVFGGKARKAVLFTTQLTAASLRDHVEDVVLLRAKEKMLFVVTNTVSNVAVVADLKPLRNRSFLYDPTYAVRQHREVADLNGAVAVRPDIACPQPAGVGLLYEVPEPSRDRLEVLGDERVFHGREANTEPRHTASPFSRYF